MSRTLALLVVAPFVAAVLWSASVAAKPKSKKKKVAKHLKAAKIAKKVPNRSRKLVRVGPRRSLRHHPKLVNVTQMKSARRVRFRMRGKRARKPLRAD